MIIDETGVDRYAFIFDINDLTPFQGVRYYPFSGELWFPKAFLLETEDTFLTEALIPMDKWLSEHTSAYRMSLIQMACHHPKIYSFPSYAINAVMVQVPESLATLFRMFWYG